MTELRVREVVGSYARVEVWVGDKEELHYAGSAFGNRAVRQLNPDNCCYPDGVHIFQGDLLVAAVYGVVLWETCAPCVVGKELEMVA